MKKIRIWPDWQMRAGESQTEWFLRILLQDLQILASGAESQIRAFPPTIPAADEMVADLDFHIQSAELAVNEGLITQEMLERARAVDTKLAKMSDRRDSALWTDEALRMRGEWVEVRRLAKEALASMGYDLEPPPLWQGTIRVFPWRK